MAQGKFDSVVIGGGIAGLTAAFYLMRAGHSVCLFEPGTLGGVIRSKELEGFTLEQGPNVFVEKDAICELRALLNLDSQTLYPAVPRYKQYVWHDGAVHMVPRSPVALMRSKLLSFKQKVALIKGLFKVAKFEEREPSVATFFSKLLGDQAVSNLLDPALRGIFGGDITKLSARAIFPLLSKEILNGGTIFSYMRNKPKGRKRKIFTIRGGNYRLISALQEQLREVRIVKEAVQDIRSLGNEGDFEVRSSSGETVRCRSVIIASAGQATGSYLSSLSNELSQELAKLKYAPIAVCHLNCSSDSLKINNGFGILFPSSRGKALMGIMFNSVLFPQVARAGREILTVCFGGVQHPKVCEMSEAQLLSEARSAVAEALGVRDATSLAVQLWPHAIPQYEIGHTQIWDKMLELERQHPGLTFVGCDIGGIGVPDRIESARAGALKVSEFLKGLPQGDSFQQSRVVGA